MDKLKKLLFSEVKNGETYIDRFIGYSSCKNTKMVSIGIPYIAHLKLEGKRTKKKYTLNVALSVLILSISFDIIFS